jgi:hypothetical protein
MPIARNCDVRALHGRIEPPSLRNDSQRHSSCPVPTPSFTAATRTNRFVGKPTAVRERADRQAALRYAAGTGSCSLSVAWPRAFQPSRPSLNVRTFV